MRDPCRSCAQLDGVIFQARALYPYSGWVNTAIRSFKYADEWSRAGELAGRMTPLVESFGTIDGIVPVPLHISKLRHRGYNQSQLLADEIGKQLNLPVMPLLRRTRETQSQVGLSQAERSANVEGAFSLDPAWSPKRDARFVLVDDVRTTSATLNACARVLQATSPARIYVVTFAYDIPHGHLHEWLAEQP
jgi:ComF family protein